MGGPPFCTGDRRGQRPLAFENFFRINEIHSWPEMPQMESWHLVPPEKSQVAGFPCAKLQGELFSLSVRERNGRKLAHFPPLVFPDTSCGDSRISVRASRATAAPAKLFCEVWPSWSEHRVRCDSMKGNTPSTTGNGSMYIINLAGKGNAFYVAIGLSTRVKPGNEGNMGYVYAHACHARIYICREGHYNMRRSSFNMLGTSPRF